MSQLKFTTTPDGSCCPRETNVCCKSEETFVECQIRGPFIYDINIEGTGAETITLCISKDCQWCKS